MDEHAIREAVRSIIIDEKAVEEELTDTYVAALIRRAYGDGYIRALSEPEGEEPDLELIAKTVAALYCRLPVG